MPENPPLLASGSRDPKKPRPLPAKVKAMIGFMVRGDPADTEAKPLDFIAAGGLAGIAPDVARRWLDRTNFRTALKAERRAFRDALCAGNELALARIRGGDNAMAAVRSIQLLEQLDEVESARSGSVPRTPGLIIQIISGPYASSPTVTATPAPLTIDHDNQALSAAPAYTARQQLEPERPDEQVAYRVYQPPHDLAPAPRVPWLDDLQGE